MMVLAVSAVHCSDGVDAGAGNDESSAIPESLLKQVESGHAESAFFIASAFADGVMGIEKNLEKAKEWFLKSAEMGYVHGMFEAANMLFRDAVYDEAKTWFSKAAKQGHGESMYRLSLYNLYEIDGELFDCKEAYKLLAEAQKRDVKPAFNDHAWMLSTLPDKSCRNGEKAWKVFSELQNLYAATEPIPWAYLDTKAAVLAEIADYNEAIEVQSWIVEDFCDVDLSADVAEFNKSVNQLAMSYKDKEDRLCYGAIQRLRSYVQRKPWRETPEFMTN